MSKKKKVYQSTDFGIAGIYFEREMAQKKIDQLNEENEKLKQQLAEKEQMILFLESQLSDFRVDITETFANWDNKQRDKIKNLEDKNKELEKLANNLSENQIQNFNHDKQLRHEICEKIREMANNYFEFPICESCGETLFASSDVIMTGSDFEKILQEIEKGEE